MQLVHPPPPKKKLPSLLVDLKLLAMILTYKTLNDIQPQKPCNCPNTITTNTVRTTVQTISQNMSKTHCFIPFHVLSTSLTTAHLPHNWPWHCHMPPGLDKVPPSMRNIHAQNEMRNARWQINTIKPLKNNKSLLKAY